MLRGRGRCAAGAAARQAPLTDSARAAARRASQAVASASCSASVSACVKPARRAVSACLCASQ
eukprot:11152882-Alexandrium_andersonii.AAC.1